jgi:hypothetical protein
MMPYFIYLFFTLIVFIGFMIPIRYLVLTIIFLLPIDRSPITISGSFLRFYQVFLIIFIVRLIIKYLLVGSIRVRKAFLFILFSWYFSYFLAIQNIISRTDFIVTTTGQLFLLIFYIIFLTYINDDQKIKSAVKVFIIGGLLSILLGLAQWIIGMIGFDVGLSHQNILSGFGRPTSFFRETDWYGMYCMYISLMLLCYSFYTDKAGLWLPVRKSLIFVLFLASCFGMFLSMTRASWAGFVVGGTLLVFFLARRYLIKIFKIIVTIIIIFLVVLISIRLSSANIFTAIIDRINPLTTTKTDRGATQTRTVGMNMAIDYIKMHPFIGNGTGGLNALSDSEAIRVKYMGVGKDGKSGAIIGGRGSANIVLTSLFDTGMIGTFLLLTFIFLYYKIMIKMFNICKINQWFTYEMLLLSLVVSFTGLLVVFMFNNGLRMGFVWFHFALSMSIVYEVKRKCLSVSV